MPGRRFKREAFARPRMIRMMTACPVTGKAMFTGLAAQTSAGLSRQLPDTLAVGCEHCGDLHECSEQNCWQEADAAPH